MGARVGYSPAWVHHLALDCGTSMLRNYQRAPLSWNSLWIHHGFVCPWSQESLQTTARMQPLAASDQPPRRHLPGKHAAQSSPRPKNSAESIAVVLVKQILRTVCSAAWRDMNSIMEVHRIIQVGHWLCEEGLRETCANRCIQMVFMSASSAGCVVSYEVRQVLCVVIRYSPTPLSAFR